MKSSSIHRSRPDLGRRRFLGQAGCAGLSALPALSTLATLATTSALAADTPGGYRAVVCLLLTGGNDSFNMLAPRGTAEHAEYAQVRQDLALPRESLLALNPTTPAGLELGLHPSMPELAALSNKAIHAPWLAKGDELKHAKVLLGEHYPLPVVDHATARARTLKRFEAVTRG